MLPQFLVGEELERHLHEQVGRLQEGCVGLGVSKVVLSFPLLWVVVGRIFPLFSIQELVEQEGDRAAGGDGCPQGHLRSSFVVEDPDDVSWTLHHDEVELDAFFSGVIEFFESDVPAQVHLLQFLGDVCLDSAGCEHLADDQPSEHLLVFKLIFVHFASLSGVGRLHEDILCDGLEMVLQIVHEIQHFPVGLSILAVEVGALIPKAKGKGLRQSSGILRRIKTLLLNFFDGLAHLIKHIVQ